MGDKITDNKYITLTQMLEARQKLLREYSSKIIDGQKDQMTTEEIAASAIYRTLGDTRAIA